MRSASTNKLDRLEWQRKRRRSQALHGTSIRGSFSCAAIGVSIMHMEHLHGTYDTLLVQFSYIVAVVASYTVLDLVGTVSATSGRSRLLWLLLGAFSMGMGIWSMHFVGMLAFSLPVPVAYDLLTIVWSIVAAVAASFAALHIVGRSGVSWRRILAGGLLLAGGIVAMHYIGMAAMLVHIVYDPLLVALSVVIAIVAAVAALWLSLYFRRSGDERASVWKKLGSGLIMGAAVVGMHYTGMIAADFHVAGASAHHGGMVLEQKWLAYFISMGTLFTLGLSLTGMYISKRLNQKDSEIFTINEELRQMNDHLEELVRERTAQLEKAHDEAIAANKIKSQFLANMSHELRTPLNAIIGYSEMLMEEAEELGEQTFVDDLGKIGRAGKHLLALINDILDISKIEAGKMELYAESFGIAAIVQDVVTTVQPLIEAGGNRIEVRAADGEITADLTKLRQILINLLSNAGKFTQNGTITFEVAAERRSGMDGFRFSVNDTGIGMTAEQMDKLFQPFTQADASTTRKYGGTGLGLTIAGRFSELMGGSIEAASEPDVGSTFVCWLPAVPPPEKPEESGPPNADGVEAGADERTSILLIDDDPANRELMERYLEKEGWRLSFAASGREGIAMARTFRPKVICLDILMPSMDGWSVLSELKNDPQLRDIPVVIWSITDDRQLGYSLGAAEFLTKPVTRERLLEVIGKYVSDDGPQPVLVVEDDAATSDLMTRLLVKEGYAVVQAGNGRHALARMAEQKPRLILLDLMMPEMDGFQFVAKLRGQPQWEDVPIIVVTAKTITSEDRLRLNGYVKNVLQKGSYDHKTLLAEIRRHAAEAV